MVRVAPVGRVVRDSRAQRRHFVGMIHTGAEVLKYTE